MNTAIEAIRSNFDSWQKGNIKDGAFSWHLHNNLLRIEKEYAASQSKWISADGMVEKYRKEGKLVVYDDGTLESDKYQIVKMLEEYGHAQPSDIQTCPLISCTCGKQHFQSLPAPPEK